MEVSEIHKIYALIAVHGAIVVLINCGTFVAIKVEGYRMFHAAIVISATAYQVESLTIVPWSLLLICPLTTLENELWLSINADHKVFDSFIIHYTERLTGWEISEAGLLRWSIFVLLASVGLGAYQLWRKFNSK